MGGFDSRQFQDMLQQAQKQAEALQEKMRQTVVEASAGGGAFRWLCGCSPASAPRC